MIYRLVSDIKQIYFTQSNMSAKITNAVNALVLAEKKAQIDEIKAYLSEKMSDADEVCELLSEFASSIEITKVVKTKKKAASDKPKKTRKKSYYHHWLSQRLKSYAEAHKGENPSERMSAISAEWAAIKEMDDFEEKKAAWEEKSASETSDAEKKIEKEPKKKTGKKVSKVIPVENVSDDDSDDDNDNTKAVVAPIESEDDDSDSDSD